MPSTLSVRRTPRGGKGGILSPLRSASPLRRPTPSSFSRLDDTGEPSPASAVAAPAVSGASDSARAAATMTPSASASALALTTPYSGRPDPRRTLTPVDLDETPPPETPSNASATANAGAGAGGFTPTTTFDSFGFPTDEKAAASASGAGAGAASGGPTAVGAIGTNNTNASDPFVSPSAASFANNHNGNGNGNTSSSNNSTPRRGSQQNITNDPFLDLTVDDDGFVVSSGFGQAHGNGRTTAATTTTTAASAAATPAAKSPAPSTAAAAAAGRPPAYRSPLPPKPNDTANATPNANASASLLSSAKKKKSLQNHFNNKATSARNTPNSQSQSVHRMSSNNSVAGNSVASASSKHIGQLAVDSNCIAGEFREIVVTLSEASTIDDDDDDDQDGHDGEGRNKHNDASRESYGSREMKRVAQSGTAGMTAEDIAFGLDPRDISQLDDDDDDDDDEYGPNGNGQYHQNGGQMFPDEAAAAAAAANARDGQNGTTATTTTNNNNDDYGPTDRTPPRHPHGPRDGAEHMVVLSESQKKLRDKLLRGSGGSGKGVHAKRPSAGTPGTRLDEHFASPTASGIPRPHDRSVMGMGMGMGMGSSQSVGGVPRSISTNNLNGVGSGEDGDAANTSPSSMISGVTNFTEGGFPSSAANPSLPSHVYRADGEELPQSAAQYRGTWMLPNGQKQGLGGQGFLPGSGVGPDYTMSYLDKPSGIDGTPASVIADRRMAAAMRAAGTAPQPPPSAASSGNSVHSAPGAGRSRGGSSSSHPAQPDDEVMRSVANRVKASMRLGPASPPPPSHPGLPRPRSVSPKPAAPSVQLRHREYADGSPRAASSAGGAANGSSIVFGAPDTFEAADSLPSIRDRAKALNDWMGGKGVKIEKEVRPTAGYTNDEMYQNAYLRRTSPQVVGSRKTIGDARASLTPPKTRPAPNSGTFAHGSSSSSSAKKSSSNGAGGSATKSRNAPAFLAKFQGNGNDALPSSPEGDAFNVADAGGSAAKSENAPAFLSKFQGNAFPEEADRELPPISVGEVAASASDQGKSPSTQASPASLKENAMPPISTSAKKAAPLTSHKSMFQQQSNTNAKSIGTDNNDDDMMFLRSWGKSRGKQSTVETPTSTSPSEDTFPGSPKFDDDGFGDIVSMNGKVPAAGDAWGVENAHDDDAWANSDADFGEPFYS